MTVDSPTDPVLVKRAKIARLVSIGQRIGYGLFLVAILAFVITKIDRPTTLLTDRKSVV